MTIQWYPGHMTKARREIQENLKLVDIVIELTDARIPVSGRNPDIAEIHSKPYVLAVTKTDLADQEQTRLWYKYWQSNQEQVVLLDLATGKGVQQLIKTIRKMTPNLKRSPRALVAGIPNVGKSSLINRVSGKGGTRVGAKPGVTRGKQWVNANGVQLLDTPGILWPKLEDQEAAKKLVTVAAIKDEIIDLEEIAKWLIQFLVNNYPELLKKRYNLTEFSDDILGDIGKKRGCLMAGGVVDRQKAANIILKEFRTGQIGKITLDLFQRTESVNE